MTLRGFLNALVVLAAFLFVVAVTVGAGMLPPVALLLAGLAAFAVAVHLRWRS